MAQFLYPNLSVSSRKCRTVFLAFLWILGLFQGLSLYNDVGHSFSSLMPAVFNSRLSIVGLFVSAFLPLLFSALAVYISQPILLYVFSYAKAVSIAFVSCLFSYHKEGAWILQLLMLFPALTGCVMLFFFSIQHISTDKALSAQELFWYALFGSLVIFLEYRFIDPILADLFIF